MRSKEETARRRRRAWELFADGKGQTEIARELGVSQPAVSRYLRGDSGGVGADDDFDQAKSDQIKEQANAEAKAARAEARCAAQWKKFTVEEERRNGPEASINEEAFNEKVEEGAAENESEKETADAKEEKERETQAQQLAKISKAAGLFHAPNGTGYADISISGHRETWPIRSKGFRNWLMREFYQTVGSVPNSNAMQSALGLIEAVAHFDGPERDVHIRVASHDGKLYLDLADKNWGAIEIDGTGYRFVDEPPVRFRRASGMLPLPMPVRGGKVDRLRAFLNVKANHDFELAVSWLLAALRNVGPYPVLALSGEQGSAKSTFTTILRSLVDPNTAPLRALPREDRDLFIAANNAHVLAFDNVSGVPTWISDTLCRLATGGGFSVRQLYTDADEVLFDSQRPIILNGIEDYVTRADLADRSVFLRLQEITEKARKAEQALMAEFECDRAKILGALLDAVSNGLKRLPQVRLERLPRMADFAKWAVACETTMWPAGAFMRAYDANRADVVDTVLEADTVATAVLEFMALRTEWDGTASELLGALSLCVSEAERRGKGWPTAPNKLSGRLNRQKTFLRQVGIIVSMSRKAGGARTRLIHIIREEKEKVGNPSSQPSQPSRSEDSAAFPNSLAEDDSGDGSRDDIHNLDASVPGIVPANSLKNSAWDDGDDGDDKNPLFSFRAHASDESPQVCEHCGTPATPKSPVQLCAIDGEEYLLHRDCRADWHAKDDDSTLSEKMKESP